MSGRVVGGSREFGGGERREASGLWRVGEYEQIDIRETIETRVECSGLSRRLPLQYRNPYSFFRSLLFTEYCML